MDLKNFDSLNFFGPEIILSATILILIVLDLFVRNKRNLAILSIVGCVASLLATFELYGATPGLLFHRMIVLDNFSLFFKVVTLVATILAIWMALGSNEIRQVHGGEYYTLLLTCALGMFFMASATNLLTAYLSLELVSLTSYVLTGFLPHNRRSTRVCRRCPSSPWTARRSRPFCDGSARSSALHGSTRFRSLRRFSVQSKISHASSSSSTSV